MFVKVHKPSKMMGANNRGTSSNLIDYLEKENQGKDEKDKERFFNLKDEFNRQEAKVIIDSGNTRLSKSDTKFYMFTINPSWKEQKHLEGFVSSKTGVDYDKNNDLHKRKFNALLKDYTKDIIQVYVDSFNRKDDNGRALKLTSEDINFVAKVEDKRTFSHWEKEVKFNKEITKEIHGLKNQINDKLSFLDKKILDRKIDKLENSYLRQDEEGNVQKKTGNVIITDMTKSGRNSHVHVVVSRQTKSHWYKGEKIIDAFGNKLTKDENKLNNARPMKLSPNAISKGESKNHKLNGNKVSVGFNHENFKEQAGKVFNKKFNYKANSKETYNSKNKNTITNKALTTINSKVKSKITQKVKQELQGDVAKTEIKIAKAIKNPVQTVKSFLKSKIKEIIKGG